MLRSWPARHGVSSDGVVQRKDPDIDDIEMLLEIVGTRALTLTEQEHIEGLRSLLEKQPDLRAALEAAIDVLRFSRKAEESSATSKNTG